MKKPRIDYDGLYDACLVVLYNEFMSDGQAEVAAKDIQNRIPDMPMNVIEGELRRLSNDNFASEIIETKHSFSLIPGQKTEYEVRTGRFKITTKGRKRVDEWEDDFYEHVQSNLSAKKLIENSPIWIGEAAETPPDIQDNKIPGSDRFVSRSDNQTDVDHLQSKVKELIREVEENRENDFPEKEGVLGELATIELQLCQPQISVPLMQTLFEQSVAWLAKKFAEVAIGQIALEALKLAAHLFGIRV